MYREDKYQLIDEFYFPKNIDPNWFRNVYKEIWDEYEYDRHGLKISAGGIVLDFGANVGAFSRYASYKGANHVYAFESDAEYFECLKLNTEETFYDITLIKGFVSDRFEFGHYNFPTIFSMFNLNEVDFCKIDIEGWEFPLLLNSKAEDIQKIKQFAIEVHGLYENGYKILEIIEMFSKNNYCVNFEHIHKEYNIGMVYAKKKDL